MVIEVGLIFSIIITNSIFLVLRVLFEQKGKLANSQISKTHTEETDYIVAHQFLIGYVNNLTVPLLIGLILDFVAFKDENTNISGAETGVLKMLRKNYSWMQWFEFVSAYFFVFVSYFKGPAKWSMPWRKTYLYFMPAIFLVIYLLMNSISIPITEWVLLVIYRKEINQSGFALYFYLCGFLQLAFVLLVSY